METKVTAGRQMTSKYIKPSKEEGFFKSMAVCFLFALFVMPQYFGIPTPVFDFTILRIMIVVMTLLIIADSGRKRDFVNLITKSKFSLYMLPYLIVISYTMVLRVDINAFLNPFIELYSLYLVIYVIRYTLGVEKTIDYVIKFIYVLALLGIVEYVIGVSPFSYLETLKGIYTGRFIRSGHYRIMSSCVHSLGYGLLLIAVVPFACLDMKKHRIDIFKRPVLLALLALNVFFTGSRSTLSVFLLELVILFLISDKRNKKIVVLVGVLLLVAVAAFLVVFNSTDIAQYIMLQITTIMDELLGTELSVNYGANLADLGSSSNYREQLKYIFTLDWLNPVLGLGRKRSFRAEINGSYIKSIDNFYIAEFVRYAYTGLLTYILFIGHFFIKIIKGAYKKKSAICRILFVGCICYFINLLWVDSLQTLKYLYIIFALYEAMESMKLIEGDRQEPETKVKSKYIKERA